MANRWGAHFSIPSGLDTALLLPPTRLGGGGMASESSSSDDDDKEAFAAIASVVAMACEKDSSGCCLIQACSLEARAAKASRPLEKMATCGVRGGGCSGVSVVTEVAP